MFKTMILYWWHALCSHKGEAAEHAAAPRMNPEIQEP